jgi:hypothetical protein
MERKTRRSESQWKFYENSGSTSLIVRYTSYNLISCFRHLNYFPSLTFLIWTPASLLYRTWRTSLARQEGRRRQAPSAAAPPRCTTYQSLCSFYSCSVVVVTNQDSEHFPFFLSVQNNLLFVSRIKILVAWLDSRTA